MTERTERTFCPKCGKDMTIEAGRVYLCYEQECVYWRLGFSDGDGLGEGAREGETK